MSIAAAPAPVPPQQSRSKATAGRILKAFDKLLETRDIESISVARLARAARCSMSSLYARFPTKESLVAAYFDAFFEQARQTSQEALAPAMRGSATLKDVVRAIVAYLVRGYQERRGPLRALIVYDRTHPEAGFTTRSKTVRTQFAEIVVRLISQRMPRQPAPLVRQRAGFGLWIVDGAAQQAVLFNRFGTPENLEGELTRMYLAYLSAS